MRALTRRGMLGGLGAVALAPGRSFAQAAEKPAVVILYFEGGFSSIFSAANNFLSSGVFSVTSSNIVDIGGGIFVDKDTFGTFSSEVKAHMGVMGLPFGWSDHINGDNQPWLGLSSGTSNPVMLARALGGTSSLRYAHVGASLKVTHTERDGVFMTPVLDLQRTLSLVTGAEPAGSARRKDEIAGLGAAFQMSKRTLALAPHVTADYSSALRGLKNILGQPTSVVDWASIASAYQLDPASSSVASMAAKFAAAELMVRAGTDVVTITANNANILGGGWDSHSDSREIQVRSEMTRLVMPSLPTFLDRMLNLPGHNVVVAIMSHFEREPYNDAGDLHGSVLRAPVFGKRIQNATTAVNPLRPLPTGRAAVTGYYALLAEAAGVTGTPLGTHPHRALLRGT